MSKKNTTPVLKIHQLKASVAGTEILHGIDLEVSAGEVHAIMGPNGSGKSTLAHVIAGHPDYEVIMTPETSVTVDGTDILELSPDQRAQAGLFLAFQYPVEIPGVKVQNFLRLAYEARFADQPERKFPTVLAFRKHVEALAAELNVNSASLKRGLNEGFSGGEKKRLEILQMAELEPKFAILDETDSGLDIDAIKAVAAGVRTIVEKYGTGIVVITHYQRILEYLKPDFVRVLVKGKVVAEGGKELVTKLEQEGYKEWTAEVVTAELKPGTAA